MTLEEIKKQLVEADIQPTSQRLAIAQYVLSHRNHPTAREILTATQETLPVISQATIYNTLNTFVKAGLIREMRSPSNDSIRYDGNTKPHHHLIDINSGQVTDINFDAITIDNLDTINKKYKIRRITVTIEGEMRS